MIDALRHRGESIIRSPSGAMWESVGGEAGVTALIQDLYRRLEAHETLRAAFAHFRPDQAIPFFVQWFGGARAYSNELAGGLLRQHQQRYISPQAAADWLDCFRDAWVARGFDPQQVLPLLRPIARAMIHSPAVEPATLSRHCDGVQDPVQRLFDQLLELAAKGKVAPIEAALAADPSLAQRRGLHQQSLAWVATYRNRRGILDLVLQAGGDVHSPGCDPLRATMACDNVHLGTGVSVTPLALAQKHHPALVPELLAHGAIDDIFTAAWVGETRVLRRWLQRRPEWINEPDPADDFQESTPLSHAVCGGNRETVQLLLDHGAEVARHSGKLLMLAIVMNRLDLVKLLIDAGADVQRAPLLGRLDDEERPIADLLVARGLRVPDWMLPRACRPDVSTNELHRVRVLLDYGAHVDDQGRYGLTALHYAVRGGQLPVIELLLDRGANVQALSFDGLTPLLQLARTRSKADPVPVMQLLVSRGADVDARDEQKGTLLMHFARLGRLEPVRWLLAHGADPRAQNRRGQTAADVCRKHPAVSSLLRQ